MRKLPLLTERVLNESKSLQTQVGQEFEGALRQARVSTSCRKGCSNCCYHPFLVTINEGVLLYRWLVEKGQWSRQVRVRAEEVRSKTMGLGFEVWLASNIACPLLNLSTNECTAYGGRPMHCRVTFSTGDAELCHPHRLGAETPLVPNTETVVQFTNEMRALLKRLGMFGTLMPLAEALLLGEAIDTGKLPFEESDLQHVRDLHGTA